MAEKHDKADEAADKKLIKKAFRMHDQQEHKGGKGTNLAKLAKGGVTSKAMMQMGRNLARVANQRSSGRGG
jgi:fructose-1-phosphate kinase PfkB-like protein